MLGRTTLLALLSLVAVAVAQAEEPSAQPTASVPDKWQYTLFNPVPANQMRSMDTNQPSMTDSPHTIDAGHFQIETAAVDYTLYRNRSAGNNVRADDFTFGQFNFRLGVLNNLEITAVINSYETVQTRDFDTHTTFRDGSFGDTLAGAKLSLWGNECGDKTWESSASIWSQFKFSTTRSDAGNGHFESITVVPIFTNLPGNFHLGVQPGVNYERNLRNTGYVTGFPTSVSLDRDVIGNLDIFLEYFCAPTTEAHAKTPQSIDVGGSYPLSKNVIGDVAFDFGLNKATSNVQVILGISVRF